MAEGLVLTTYFSPGKCVIRLGEECDALIKITEEQSKQEKGTMKGIFNLNFGCTYTQRWRNHFESGGAQNLSVFSPTGHNLQL